jgi:ABC-type phosphate transport system permease subunit
MKLNLKALTAALAILWAGLVLVVGVASLIWPGYGKTFLQVLASIYPGYAASGSFGDVIVGSLYALVDAAVVGFIFGWLYNLIAGGKNSSGL